MARFSFSGFAWMLSGWHYQLDRRTALACSEDESPVGSSNFPLDTQLLTVVAWGSFWFYFVAFLTYEAMRRMVNQWDRKDYQSLTGESPTVHWATEDA